MAIPAPRSRISIPVTSAPTEPMAAATRPRVPGRSGNHRRITWADTSAEFREPAFEVAETLCDALFVLDEGEAHEALASGAEADTR